METKDNQEQDNGEIGKEPDKTNQTQKIYQNTFGHSHICLTKRNSKSYRRDMNGTTR